MLAVAARGLRRLRPPHAPPPVTQQGQPHRCTVIVARKHELDRPYPELDRRPIRELDDYPDRVPIYSKLYETSEHLAIQPESKQLLQVRLHRDIPGLGESGQLVSVHRSRFWHYLYPLDWASIVPEGQAGPGQQQQQQKADWRNSRVFTGPLFRLQRTLEAMHLLVPVNLSGAGQLTLSDRHVCVSFRRYGVEIPRHAVRLPDRPPLLASAKQKQLQQRKQRDGSDGPGIFKVGVRINSHVTVWVKASLHPVALGDTGSGLPPAQLPHVEVDNWQTEMHPMPKLPEGVRVFDPYLLQEGPPDFQKLLGSNRTRVYKNK